MRKDACPETFGFKALHGDAIPDTIANLKRCLHREHYEWDRYVRRIFLKLAKEEGSQECRIIFLLLR